MRRRRRKEGGDRELVEARERKWGLVMGGSKEKRKWAEGDGLKKKAKESCEQYKKTGEKRWREGEWEIQTYSERGGSVCLLLCSTWIHLFLSAFHSHSLARSLCHCHARALSFFSPFSLRLLAFLPPLYSSLSLLSSPSLLCLPSPSLNSYFFPPFSASFFFFKF